MFLFFNVTECNIEGLVNQSEWRYFDVLATMTNFLLISQFCCCFVCLKAHEISPKIETRKIFVISQFCCCFVCLKAHEISPKIETRKIFVISQFCCCFVCLKANEISPKIETRKIFVIHTLTRTILQEQKPWFWSKN